MNYTKLWSDGNLELISNNIYDQPISIYSKDSILYLKSNEDVKSFLAKTFKNLEDNNYGFSTINKWESYREDKNYVIIEMNFPFSVQHFWFHTFLYGFDNLIVISPASFLI